MIRRMNKLVALLAPFALVVTTLLTTPAQAGGSISIPLPPLPPIPHIKLPAPPLMVWLPTPAVHVALDSPYPIFHHENHYYLHSNNVWYVGPGYQGPWAFVHVHLLPPGLRHYRGHEWNHYQHEARYQLHHEHRAHPNFYSHQRFEHHASSPPVSHWDNPPPRYEPRGHYDNQRKTGSRPPARHSGRDQSRVEQHERSRVVGRAQFNNHVRSHNMSLAQNRNESRGQNYGRRQGNF